MLVWWAREKQNILTSPPCLHTLMQTLLTANQSACTILLILSKLLNRKKRHKKSHLRANISFTVKSKQKNATGTMYQTEGRRQMMIYFRYKWDYPTANVYHHGHYASIASVRGRYKVGFHGLERFSPLILLDSLTVPNKKFAQQTIWKSYYNLEHLLLLCKRIIILESTLLPSRRQ